LGEMGLGEMGLGEMGGHPTRFEAEPPAHLGLWNESQETCLMHVNSI